MKIAGLKVAWAQLLSSKALACLCFAILLLSGFFVGSELFVHTRLLLSSYFYLGCVLVLLPNYLRNFREKMRCEWVVWSFAVLALVHPRMLDSEVSIRLSAGIYFGTACGVLIGNALPLWQLLASFFFCLRFILIVAILYTCCAPESSIQEAGNTLLWKSFFGSSNSMAVIVGALAIDYIGRFATLSRGERVLSSLCLLVILLVTRSITVALALAAVSIINSWGTLGRRKIIGGAVTLMLVVVIGIAISGVDITPLIRLHGRVPQWRFYLSHFDSFWLGLGPARIEIEPYAIEFQRRFFRAGRIYVDNGYLSIFFDYGLTGLALFGMLIQRVLRALDASSESKTVRNLLVYLGIVNLTGGWLLYSSSPWWLLITSLASCLAVTKGRAGGS